MDKNKKIICVVVIVILLAICGFFIFYKLLQDDKANIQDKNKVDDFPSIVEIAVDDELVLNSLNKYSYSLCKETAFMVSKIYAGHMNINNLTKQDLIKLALSNSMNIPMCVLSEDEFKTVTVTELNNSLKRIFPSSEELTYNDVVTNMTTTQAESGIRWDSIGDFYIILNDLTDDFKVSSNNCDGCGVGPTENLFTKVVKAERDGNNLYVYQKMAIARPDTTNPSEEDIANDINWYMSLYKEVTDNAVALQTVKKPYVYDEDINWDLYNTYKWTFKMDNNEFYLESVILSEESN